MNRGRLSCDNVENSFGFCRLTRCYWAIAEVVSVVSVHGVEVLSLSVSLQPPAYHLAASVSVRSVNNHDDDQSNQPGCSRRERLAHSHICVERVESETRRPRRGC